MRDKNPTAKVELQIHYAMYVFFFFESSHSQVLPPTSLLLTPCTSDTKTPFNSSKSPCSSLPQDIYLSYSLY